MNDLQIFTNSEFGELRTASVQGETWFCLSDICRPLGIRVTDCKNRLKSEGVVTIDTPTNSGTQKMFFINEPNVYRTIFQSRKPEAERFMEWLTEDVLPALNRTGHYEMVPVQPMTPAQLIAAQAQVLVDMEKRMDEMQSQTEALEAKVDTAIKVFSKPAEDHWKADMDEAIKRFCTDNHLSVLATRGRMYDELERAVNCNVDSRLARLRTRKRKAGARYRDVMALTKLDAIAADKQLRAVFEGIVRKWQAQAVERFQNYDTMEVITNE